MPSRVCRHLASERLRNRRGWLWNDGELVEATRHDPCELAPSDYFRRCLELLEDVPYGEPLKCAVPTGWVGCEPGTETECATGRRE